MRFTSFLFLALTFLFSSIHCEEVNKVSYYQINYATLAGRDVYWISLDVKRYFFTYDDSNNLVVENLGTHSFQIFHPDVGNFNTTDNSDVQILSESTFKNAKQEAIFMLKIDNKIYRAYGSAINSASELWDDLSLQVSGVKKLGDWRSGMTTTRFTWRGYSFSVFSDLNLKNRSNLTLKWEDRGRMFGESKFTFITDDGSIFYAYGDSIWSRFN